MRRKRLFCEINPVFYEIALKKEIVRRHLKNIFSHEKFAKTKQTKKLPAVVFNHSSELIKKGKGIDPLLQEGKATNIRIASEKINGLIIRPGETFSFWKIVGKTTKRKGYRDGRIINGNQLKPGKGGGLCNLANTIHLLVLHSPLDVEEFHHHSDALAPDHGERIPFSSGTSVLYNSVDYRFKNNTDQKVQLLIWCDHDCLCAQLRSEREYPWSYELQEEDHHFVRLDDKYFRRSRIYRNVKDKKTGEILRKELILDNKSEVMYDWDLIPQDQIREK